MTNCKDGFSPLVLAVKEGDVDAVKYVVCGNTPPAAAVMGTC